MRAPVALLAVVMALARCATGSQVARDADSPRSDFGRAESFQTFGIPPAAPGLTPAQRLVAARTAALVAPTVEHAARRHGSLVQAATPAGPGMTQPSRIETRTHATLPGGIEVRGRTAFRDSARIEMSASVEWRERDGRTLDLTWSENANPLGWPSTWHDADGSWRPL